MDSKPKNSNKNQSLTIRRKIWDVIDIKYSGRKGMSFVLNLSLSILIFINTIAIILNTIPGFDEDSHRIFRDFEIFSVCVFLIEYLLRLYSCVESTQYKHWFWGRLKFIFSFWGIVDLLAIAPFFLTAFVTDFGVIRMLRLLRILRLFRMSKYFHALTIIRKVLYNKREELILSFSFILFLMLFSSSLMYFFENPSQPEVFSSIPAALWWGVNTMTTVGYGDIYPVTIQGKILGSLTAISGISLFALPAGIIASGFNEQIRGNRTAEGKVKCPYCEATYYLAERNRHNH